MENNILTKTREIPVCTIKYDLSPGNAHISQVLAGFKMLDKNKIIKVADASPCNSFRTSGNYEHNSIIEVNFGNKTLAYDMADGYQSIHRKDVFDKQLDRLDFYFKRSYLSDFHSDMRNKDKVKALGLNYYCTCKGNYYDAFIFKNHSVKEYISFFRRIRANKSNTFDYSIFESNNQEYDKYNLLFLTRIWDSSGITVQGIMNTYPYFSEHEAKIEAEKWRESLDSTTRSRLNYIKVLKNHFGDKIIAGVSDDDFSRKICPELIIDSKITERNNYINLIKQNYICITSEGLHHSIGWKFGEYVAAGKAIISEPPYYEIPHGFNENTNYLTYKNENECIQKCEYLMSNIDAVHRMEAENRLYYSQHLKPDRLVLDSLITAFNE